MANTTSAIKNLIKWFIEPMVRNSKPEDMSYKTFIHEEIFHDKDRDVYLARVKKSFNLGKRRLKQSHIVCITHDHILNRVEVEGIKPVFTPLRLEGGQFNILFNNTKEIVKEVEGE